LWALDRAGATSWVTHEPGPLNFSSVEVANGVAYISDFSAVVTAHDASNGAVLARLPVGAPSFGGVAIVGKALFTVVGTSMSSSGSVIAFGNTSGSAATRPRLRLSVRPRRVRTGRRTVFRFRVTTSHSRPVRGATVRFAGKHRRTSRSGRARIVAVLHRAGRKRARASKRGYRSGLARVRAVRRRHR